MDDMEVHPEHYFAGAAYAKIQREGKYILKCYACSPDGVEFMLATGADKKEIPVGFKLLAEMIVKSIHKGGDK